MWAAVGTDTVNVDIDNIFGQKCEGIDSACGQQYGWKLGGSSKAETVHVRYSTCGQQWGCI